MDQTFVNFALGVASAVLGWLGKTVWQAVQELKSDLAKLREELPKDYVARDDYREDIKEIKLLLQKLFEKVEGKADRHG